MAPSGFVRRISRVSCVGTAAAILAGLGGCRADYGADIRNMTPQPVFAQLYERHDDGVSLLASERLGPGDRALVGPVRVRKGRAGLVIDTKPNPESPVYFDLPPGIGAFNVHQRGEATGGPLMIEEVTNPR
ncbi:MAG: hypothetical protein H7Y88_08535 [Phycisphaerales bacterium]|nr:hypothetical protein [Phycisphaerales bacterium]